MRTVSAAIRPLRRGAVAAIQQQWADLPAETRAQAPGPNAPLEWVRAPDAGAGRDTHLRVCPRVLGYLADLEERRLHGITVVSGVPDGQFPSLESMDDEPGLDAYKAAPPPDDDADPVGGDGKRARADDEPGPLDAPPKRARPSCAH